MSTVSVVGTSLQYWAGSSAFSPSTQSRSVTSGGTLISLGGWWDDTGASSSALPTDSAGTFTAAVNVTTPSGSPVRVQIAYQAGASAGSHVVTPPSIATNGDGYFTLLEVAGLTASSPLRDSGHTRNYHAPVTPPDAGTIQTITATTAGSSTIVGDLLLAVLVIDPNSTSNSNAQILVPSGWTQLAVGQDMTDNIGYMVIMKLATAAGSQSVTFNWTDANTFVTEAAISSWKKDTAYVTKATFDPSRKGANYTLSSGDMVATKTSASDQVAFLQFTRTAGKYWDEFVLGANTNVEYNGLGVGNASASVSNYLGADTNGVQVYEDATRGTWVKIINGATTTVKTGGPQASPTNVLVMLTNADAKMFFLGMQTAGAGAVSWITGDPNTSLTSGGIDYSSITGAVAPGWDNYYNSEVVTYRTAAQHSATAYMPGGVTQQWDDATAGGTTYNKNLSVSHVGTVTRTRSISVRKAVSSVNSVTRQRQISVRKAVSSVSTNTFSAKNVFVVTKNVAHTATTTLRKQVSKVFATAAAHAVTVAKLISVRKAISHVAAVTKLVGIVTRKTLSVAHTAVATLPGKLYIPAGSGPGLVPVLWNKLRLGLGFN